MLYNIGQMLATELDTTSPLSETKFIVMLCDQLAELGVGTQVLKAVREEADGCGVALGLVAPEIIRAQTGQPIPAFEVICGEPRYDGYQAPVRSKMNRLRERLKNEGLL